MNYVALLPPGEALPRGSSLVPWYYACTRMLAHSHTHTCAPHLQDFALGTLWKQQHLVIQRVQRLAGNFGLLLGNADAVLQQVGLDVGRWGQRPAG